MDRTDPPAAGFEHATPPTAGRVATLAGHRIAAVTTATTQSRYPRDIGRNARLGRHGTGPATTAVAVTTDVGAIGWALATGPLDGVDDLVGRDLTALFDPQIGVIDDAAGSLDLALHDLAGVVLGRSVAGLLGARGTPSVPTYSGAIYFDDLDAPDGIDTVLAHCRDDYAAGYRALKLKVGRGHRWMTAGGLSRDIAVVHAVREAFPDIDILTDANDGFTLQDARTFLDATAECRLFWLEEPFEENRADLTALYAHLTDTGIPTLLADGERDPDLEPLLALGAAGVLDVLLMDIGSFGLTAWRAAMPRLIEVGVSASPHAWGEPLKSLYAAQVAAGLGNVLTVEGVPGTAWVDGQEVDRTAYRLAGGVLTVPTAPGFGIRVPPALRP
ncbi:MAG: enolase C-terminal domain-like protein [Mycobacteriales bacterium]